MSVSSTRIPSASAKPDEPSLALESSARSEVVLVPALLLAAVYAIPLLAAVRPVADPILDPDVWWHLRVGQWICEHRAVPTTDPFSIHGAEKAWVAYSWLYEVLVYGLYEAFGLAGIVIYRAAMSLAVVAVLHRLIHRRVANFHVALGLTAIASLAMTPLFSERPWLFTLCFTTLTLDTVLTMREQSSARAMWLLPLVFALWANLHIQFVYGFLLLGLACVVPWLDAKVLHLPSARTRRLFWVSESRTIALTGLCFAATLINPYHVRLYGVVWEYATQPGPFRCINELRALEFREMPDWVVLLLGAAAVFVLGRQRRASSFDLLLLAGAGVLAFRARRDLWFLVVAAALILAKASAGSLRGRQLDPPSMRLRFSRRVAAAGILMAVTLGLAWQRDLSTENLRRTVARVFPVESAAIVAERGYIGPIFNDFNWGGFLIWSLPQHPVVLDGRTNLHGDERMLRIGNTWAAGPGWRDDPDLLAANLVLADVGSPLGNVLAMDERFEFVHEDAVARLFVRKREEGREISAAQQERHDRENPIR